MKQKEITVGSISELISNLTEMGNELIWFRGQGNKDWTLLPVCYREGQSYNEMDTIKKFKQDASLLIDRLPNSLSHWLFIMRHYGVSTRLLDWTEDPLVALFFATENPEVDGKFWMLKPIVMNKQDGRFETEFSELPSFEENTNIMKTYSPEDLYFDSRSSQTPIAFIGPRNTPRMQAQSSVFVIYHRNKTSLEKLGKPKFVTSYIIPKKDKVKIKKELKLLRVDNFRLFPELQYIKEKMGDA